MAGLYGGALPTSKSGIDISLFGDKQLKRNFDDLSTKLQKKYTRKALREGAKIVANTWKATVPVDTGDYRAGIKVRSMKRSRSRIGIRIASPTRKFLAKRAAKSAGRSLRKGRIADSFASANRSRRLLARKGSQDYHPWYYPALLEYGGVKKSGQVIPAGGHGRKAFARSKARAWKVIRWSLWMQILNAIRIKPLRKAA